MPTETASGWRRLRGALGLGFAWGVAWSLVALVLAVIEYWSQFRAHGLTARNLRILLEQAALGGFFGFASGVLFATVLALLSRAKWFKGRSIGSFVGAGGLGMAGTVLLYLTLEASYLFDRSGLAVAVTLGWFGLLGAVSAMVTLGMVKHADRRALGNPRQDQLPLGSGT